MSNSRIDHIAQHIQKKSEQSMTSSYSPLTTHILDTANGVPAKKVPITVFVLNSQGKWQELAKRETNDDGRCPGLLTKEQFVNGTYKMYFDTGNYFRSMNSKGFYPYVEIVFEIEKCEEHYHVPLLLSPYGYSTYRGS